MAGHQADMLQATVLADVAIVLIVGALLLHVSRLARQPAVIGEILAGVALGPSLLGLLPGHLTKTVFPTEGRPYLSVIAQVGLLLFMFILGWELDPGHLRRSRGAVAAVSAGSITVPFILGIGAAALCYHRYSTPAGHRVPLITFALYLAVAMSVTAFPVLARILADTELSTTGVGRLALASAALGDLVAWCLLAVVVGMSTAHGTGGFLSTVGWSAGYLVGMVTVVRPLLGRLITRQLARGSSLGLTSLVAAGALLSAYLTTLIGIHPIFGAFAFGMVMPSRARLELEMTVQQPLRDAGRLLLPVYFIVTGLSVNVGALRGRDWWTLALMLAVACLGKLLGATLPAAWTGLPWRQAFGVGLLMNTRGLTELIILNIGLSLGVLDNRLFTIMVLVALITTAMAGPLVPYLVPRSPAVLPAAQRAGTGNLRDELTR